MAQKFYLHDAVSPVAGTMPGATTLSTATSPNVTAAGAATNRDMHTNIGSAQVGAALSTAAQAIQHNWFRRFCSRPLAAQTIPGFNLGGSGLWTFHAAMSESNTNSGIDLADGVLAIWRPSTGVAVTTLFDAATSVMIGGAATISEQVMNGTVSVGPDVVVAAGDILVWEVWGTQSQSMSTSYTNTLFYDGTTEDSVTSEAAYVLAPVDLPFVAADPNLLYQFDPIPFLPVLGR